MKYLQVKWKKKRMKQKQGKSAEKAKMFTQDASWLIVICLVRVTRSWVYQTFNRELVFQGTDEFPWNWVSLRLAYSNISSLCGKDHLGNDRVVKEFEVHFFRRSHHRFYYRYVLRFDTSDRNFLKFVSLLNPRMVSPYNLEKFPILLPRMPKCRLDSYVYPEVESKKRNYMKITFTRIKTFYTRAKRL